MTTTNEKRTPIALVALIVSAVVGLIGLVTWLVVLQTVRPIDWSADSALPARIASSG